MSQMSPTMSPKMSLLWPVCGIDRTCMGIHHPYSSLISHTKALTAHPCQARNA